VRLLLVIATILGYHEVDPATVNQERTPRLAATGNHSAEMRRYTVTPEQFAEQLDYIQKNGYSVIPLADLVDFLEGRRAALPPRPVVITIDDGWACTATQMAPELKKRGMPFTVFIYPGFVGKGSHSLTWKDIDDLAAAGADIQSHSWSHPFLTKTPTLERELAGSRSEIERRTRKPVRFLAYPYGDYDHTVAGAASRFGYAAAVTTEREPVGCDTSPMQLGRYLIHNDTTLDKFRTFLPPR
jgi:peptidoglycan/xylan/chitin deacetylase (PgdA/CDA1 family)